MMSEKDETEIDPKPEYVEGIFFVQEVPITNVFCCRKNNSRTKLCIYDARSLYLFNHKTRFR